MWSVAAGHPAPRVVRADGRVEALDAGGPLLGVVPDARFACAEATLAPGDALLLFSDGLTESIRRGRQSGARRASTPPRAGPDASAHALLDRLVAASDAFAGPDRRARRPDGHRDPAPQARDVEVDPRAAARLGDPLALTRPAGGDGRQQRPLGVRHAPPAARLDGLGHAQRLVDAVRHEASPPPHENHGTCRGGTAAPKTLANTPTTVPVENAVWMAHFEWSPMTRPRNCRPDGTKSPATASYSVTSP